MKTNKQLFRLLSFFVFLIIMHTNSYGQEYEYHPFPVYEDTPFWVYVEYMKGDPHEVFNYFCFFLEDEVQINQDQYYPIRLSVIQQYEQCIIDTSYWHIEDRGIFGYYRVNEERNKVYFLPVDGGKDSLLYDFTLQEGDYYEGIEITNIDTLPEGNNQFKGGPRKVYMDDAYKLRWYEGHGSWEAFPGIKGLSILDCDPVMDVKYFWLADTLVAPNVEIDSTLPYPELFYLPIENLEKQMSSSNQIINLYPNPASNTLNIDLPDQKAYRITIYSLSGNMVYSQLIENTDVGSVNLEHLVPAPYMVNIIGVKTGFMYSKIIMKE
ncbi:MAG: T9SS type A sorting domain-containing protein [Bacteroidales bacterium]|nr:T9SS type A sorting domain-containing protein [Bacteroidales bacterium]